MKINPVSIQSYQEAVKPDRPGERRTISAPAEQSVTIDPQKNKVGSELAVNLKGASYADSLSPEEKQALDMLFGKFRGEDRFGGNYQSESSGGSTVGRMIDVKV